MTPNPPATLPAAAVRPDQPFRSRAGVARTDRLLGEGLIRSVLADVFVARDVPVSLRLRAEAAALMIPPHRRREQSWVVGFESAAWVYTGWRLPLRRPGSGTEPGQAAEPGQAPGSSGPRLDVLIPSGANRPLDPWIRARQARLDAIEVVVLHGLAITDPIRTAADIARELPPGPASQLLGQLGELAQVTPAQVLYRLGQMRYARGAARARAIIRAWQQS